MRTVRHLVIAGIIAGLLGMAAPAHAYPKKSELTAAGWNCFKAKDDSYFLMSLTMEDKYSIQGGGQGNYRYKKDAGKVNFRSGPLEEFFGRLTEGLGGWNMAVRRDATNKLWASCQNYTAGGM